MIAGLLAALTLTGCVTSFNATPQPSTPLTEGRAIVPPFGMTDWCQRHGAGGGFDDDICRCWRVRHAGRAGQVAAGCLEQDARRASDKEED